MAPSTEGRAPKGILTPVLRVALTRERLVALSPDERVILFLFGYSANQIGMLSKLILFSTSKSPDDPVEQKLSGAQSQMLSRIAIGILAETWESVRARFLDRPVGKIYAPLLDTAGRDALATLKRHFGQSSLLTKVRNNYAFHHPRTEDVEAAFKAASLDKDFDEEWNVYLAQSHLNAFFFASDVVILHGIMGAIGETDIVQAQLKVMAEVRLVADALVEFIYSLFGALWRRNFGADMPAEVCGNVETAPQFDDVWIPFFIRVDGQST